MSSGLGDFAKLPAEIRLIIWGNCFSSKYEPDNLKLRPGYFSVILASRQINHEITHLLYNGRVFVFRVYCTVIHFLSFLPTRETNRVLISRFMDTKAPVKVYPHAHFFPNEDVWCRNWGWLPHLPLSRLSSIHIEVTTPPPHNHQLQMIQLWNTVCFLVQILERNKNLPPIKIIPFNGELNWDVQMKLRSMTPWPTRCFRDIEIILMPFHRLKKTHHIELVDRHNVISQADHQGPSRVSVEDYEDVWQVKMQQSIDILDCVVRPNTKLTYIIRRMLCWNSHYEKQQIACIQSAWQCGRFTDHEYRKAFESLADRYRHMRAFNQAWVAVVRNGSFKIDGIGRFHEHERLIAHGIDMHEFDWYWPQSAYEEFFSPITDKRLEKWISGKEGLLAKSKPPIGSKVCEDLMNEAGIERDDVIITFDGLSLKNTTDRVRHCPIWLCPRQGLHTHNAAWYTAFIQPEMDAEVVSPLLVEVTREGAQILQKGRLLLPPKAEPLQFVDKTAEIRPV